MAGRFVDFYALLNVASDASSDAVRAAVVQQRRACEEYQATGDPADQKVTDDRIHDIDLAELVLLDPEQRADYDEEWRGRRNGTDTPAPPAAAPPALSAVPDAPPTAHAGNGSLAPEVAPTPPLPPPVLPTSAIAGQSTAQPTVVPDAEPPALEPDPQQAAAPPTAQQQAAAPPTVNQPSTQPATRQQAAYQAQHDTAEPEDDWIAQARTALQVGDTALAIDSYHYAIMLHPHEIGLHYELGQAYVLAGNYEQALGAYETATRLAPHVADYRAAVGNALVHLARPGEAIGVLEQVVAEVPTEPRYRAELAQSLHDTCVHEMTALAGGMVCITTAEQAQLVERLTTRALSLLDPYDTSQLAEDIREKHRLAQLATNRVWRPPLPWWLMIAFTVVITLGFALFVIWWSAPIVLAVLGGVAFLLGLQPTYWHVAREAKNENLLAQP